MSHPRPQGVPAAAPPPGYPAPAVYPGGHLPPSGSVPQAYSAPPAGYPAPHGYVTPHGGRRFHIVLRKHTGLVVIRINQAYRFTGTFEECRRAYRAAQLHNLLAGWWGVASLLVWNWVTIVRNETAMRDLRRLAAQPPGPCRQP